MKAPNYTTRYRSLFERGILTDEIVDTQREYYERNKTHFARGLEESTRTFELGDRRFRAVSIRGESDDVIIIGSEYANANFLHTYVRAMGLRAILSPAASMVLVPNNKAGEDNLALSANEKTLLRRGDATPFIDRYRQATTQSGISDNALTHVIGMSLGAATGLPYAAHPDTPTQTTTLVETPFLSDMNLRDMVMALKNGTSQMGNNLAMSRQGIEDFPAIDLDTRIIPTVRYYAGVLLSSNLATAQLMRHRDAADDIAALRHNHPASGLVVAYGTEAQISPIATNEAIAADYVDNPHTEFVDIPGADHSVTNAHAVVAALALRAKSLAA